MFPFLARSGVAQKATPFFTRVAAALHTIALLIALLVQNTNSVFAGAWLFFHLAGCGCLLYTNQYPKQKTFLWWTCLAWLLAVSISCFLITPVHNGAYWMWVLTAMPMVMLSLRPENLAAYIKYFGTALVFYAVILSLQRLTGVNLSPIAYEQRMAWPLIDPNNAAAMLNLGFTPFLYLMLFKDLRWGLLAGLFAYALYATGSRTGLGAATLSATILYTYRYGLETLLLICAVATAAFGIAFFYQPALIADGYAAVATRFPIWWAALHIWETHPLRGDGIGSLQFHFLREGATVSLPPAFAHNDTLQFAAEMGAPVAVIFISIMVAVFAQANKRNLVTTCTAMAIFIQSMLEFPFYLPSITIGMGLVLAFHDINRRRSFD